jgi:nitrogen fixation protein NifX
MPAIGHVKIALATNSLTHVDASFIGSRQIVFYDVSRTGREFLDVVRFGSPQHASNPTSEISARPGMGRNGGACCMMSDPTDGEGTDRLGERVEAMRGTSILFCSILNDLAAVRLRDVGVFPVKMEQRRDIDSVIDALQQMMNAQPYPPLWLRRAQGYHRTIAPNDEPAEVL